MLGRISAGVAAFSFAPELMAADKDSAVALGYQILPVSETPDEVINLWPEGSAEDRITDAGRPRLEIWYAAEPWGTQRPTVMVCPGGGYRRLAPHEGAAIAKFLVGKGFNAAVCYYRVPPKHNLEPLYDATRGIRYIRKIASTEKRIHPQKIGIMGFSAGGHLSGTMATFGKEIASPIDDFAIGVNAISARPDFAVLCYPVLSFLKKIHQGSVTTLLGEAGAKDDALLQRFSVPERVSAETCPTFLWHTATDPAVPVENSLMYAAACSENKVPYALHVFPEGRHGLGLAIGEPLVSQWPDLLVEWLRRL